MKIGGFTFGRGGWFDVYEWMLTHVKYLHCAEFRMFHVQKPVQRVECAML